MSVMVSYTEGAEEPLTAYTVVKSSTNNDPSA